jgi:hypothetical protein
MRKTILLSCILFAGLLTGCQQTKENHLWKITSNDGRVFYADDYISTGTSNVLFHVDGKTIILYNPDVIEEVEKILMD